MVLLPMEVAGTLVSLEPSPTKKLATTPALPPTLIPEEVAMLYWAEPEAVKVPLEAVMLPEAKMLVETTIPGRPSAEAMEAPEPKVKAPLRVTICVELITLAMSAPIIELSIMCVETRTLPILSPDGITPEVIWEALRAVRLAPLP